MQKYASMFGISLVGSFVSFLIGSMDSLVMILLCFVIADYVTGLIASAIEGRLSSQVGFRGIVRKLLIFVLVAVSHLLEIAIGWNNHFIRDAIIFFYITNEFISIVENAGRAGVPIPSFLRKAIELFKDEMN
ncbi:MULTISPECIES: phage holin family protein [Anoxybacillaceae]|jgi:toxin secretion/phage lysis holin|uniref:Holin n=1 Tax=Parageobacillus galactosidasius TaxID=883812 RepID=A0A226QMU0_9BACL|nr:MULTISPECIES: phage holin family protein [Bacillaceae]MED4969286.1 phage holin family protein [Parageobacillus toebii]MED4988499.1 phage holin family protein [Parageobacillus toebii]OXB92762.1 holin [Parageobacillus galactosidasius]QSB49718.1 phage holin family protein [Parageobacillus toebii]WMT19546.1 phage holin family protein [Parageobacillus toebii]